MTQSEETVPETVRQLMQRIVGDGGETVTAYKEPLGDHWHIFALLPVDKVEPTPYQRDRSPTHVKRLQNVMDQLQRFIDPLVVVRTKEGRYWVPNGAHRLTALKKLKAARVPVILIPESDVAYRILALNTEKAHNLKEKSLEVIRMYRDLIARGAAAAESAYAFEFEEPQFVTLGLAYEERPRLSGSVYSPILKRVDTFLDEPLARALPEREKRARKVLAADMQLTKLVTEVRDRGIQHPFVKNYIMARCNPVSRARKNLPDVDTALDKLRAALESFNPNSVRLSDVSFAGGPPAQD